MEQSMYGVSVSTLRKYEPHFDHIPQPVTEELRLSPHLAVSLS